MESSCSPQLKGVTYAGQRQAACRPGRAGDGQERDSSVRKRVYLCLAHMSGEEQRFVREAFDTEWVAPLGPNVDGFERDLETYVGHDRHIVALSSGTAAIHLALVLLGVGRDDEVICQSFTFAASANPIVYQGATPVFVDSEPLTWNMSPTLLETAVKERLRLTGKKPKAIIVAHLYGMPAQLDAILDVAARYDIPVVEDAAEALGSTFGGRPCGTFGTFGIFSFNGNKMITTSGGGALVCPTEELKRRATFYATQAREPMPYYQHEKIGFNYRLSNVCAGIGRGQMTILDRHIAHHRRAAALYADLLREVKGMTLHLCPTDRCDSNYWLNAVVIDPESAGTDSGEVCRSLADENIESRPLWKPLHLQPVFRDAPAYVNGVSERLFGKGLCLPSGPCVTDGDIMRIVEVMKQCTRSC